MSLAESKSVDCLRQALERLDKGFEGLPQTLPIQVGDDVRAVLLDVAERLQDNYPYQHPLYAGQMLKPPHAVARVAYTLAMHLNPNNHALDGGRASSEMEKEAVAEIAGMFGWPEHLGHLCGGGTMANLEALWVAGKLEPGKKTLASTQAHYTHSRITDVLQLDFAAVPVDVTGRMDLDALRGLLDHDEVGTVVATLGTTGLGAVDPLPEILELQARYGFTLHADAAYGGYFTLCDSLSADARAAFDCLDRVDSIVIDPHKQGLQPYGCGCVLFRDPSVGTVYKHESPYTYFSSDQLHLGEISLECSRAGASAVALWATQRLLPLIRGGDFARGLGKSLEAARALFTHLQTSPNYLTLSPPQLDIVVWAPRQATGSEIGARSRALFDAAADEGLHLALIDLPVALLGDYWPEVLFDTPTVTCLRSCLMKPEHLDWMGEITLILERIASE
jgi:glutamate/tyrosine decarboxylase-like PLP-dependent enzyme